MKNIMKGTVHRSVAALSKHLDALHDPTKRGKQQRAPKKLTSDISKIHQLLYGDVDSTPNPENGEKIVHKLLKHDLFLKLTENIQFLEFDAIKYASDILNYVIRRCQRNRSHIYVQSKTDRNGYNPIINALLHQYDQNMSNTLHEMVKRPELTQMLLTQIKIPIQKQVPAPLYQDDMKDEFSSISSISTNFSVSSSISSYSTSMSLDSTSSSSSSNHTNHTEAITDHDFVDELLMLAQNPCFNISSNAFSTLYQLLIHGDKKVLKIYLKSNYQRLFDEINKLIGSDNFVTQKQFLMLLRDLITNVSNYGLMIKYVSDKKNLAVIMTVMKKYQYNSISLQAYDIFKVFIANPKKPKCVQIILWKNKQRLVDLLSAFHDKKARQDPHFAKDKEIVIHHLKKICLPQEYCRMN